MKIRQMQERLKANLRQAERENLRDGKRIARKYSTGSISSAELRQLGHPYATRAPQFVQHPAIINRQSGTFFGAWSTHLGSWQSGGMVSVIRNSAPYAGYLDRGTRYMIERPIRDFVQRDLKQIRKARLQKAVADALRT